MLHNKCIEAQQLECCRKGSLRDASAPESPLSTSGLPRVRATTRRRLCPFHCCPARSMSLPTCKNTCDHNACSLVPKVNVIKGRAVNPHGFFSSSYERHHTSVQAPSPCVRERCSGSMLTLVVRSNDVHLRSTVFASPALLPPPKTKSECECTSQLADAAWLPMGCTLHHFAAKTKPTR